jgi:hypothetical protein
MGRHGLESVVAGFGVKHRGDDVPADAPATDVVE